MILFTAAAFDLEIVWFTFGVHPELFHNISDWNNTINIEGITLPNHNTIFLSHHDNEHFKNLRRLSEEEVDRAIRLNRDIRENYGRHQLRPPPPPPATVDPIRVFSNHSGIYERISVDGAGDRFVECVIHSSRSPLSPDEIRLAVSNATQRQIKEHWEIHRAISNSNIGLVEFLQLSRTLLSPDTETSSSGIFFASIALGIDISPSVWVMTRVSLQRLF